MKILLINPPRTYAHGSKGVRLGLPLGVMYLAAALEKNSVKVNIFDSLISETTQIIEYQDYTFHGVSDDYLKEVIKRENPDILGISCPFTAQIENTIKTANLVKQVSQDILVIVGGPHFAVLGKEFLKENPNIDLAVAGEGEETMVGLADALKNKKPLDKISGLIFRSEKGEIKANQVKLIKTLDVLPLPAYHLIDMDRYFYFLSQGFSARPNKKERAVSMITSRGCPFNCVFCSIHLHMGRLWRAHSADYVISHIDYLIRRYRVKHISFEDDNFTFNPQRTENIIDQLIKKKIKISWDTPNGVRADTLSENLLAKMKQANCDELIVGAESGDQEILDKIINKSLKLETIVQTAKWCKKLKIKLRSFFVIGFPGETKVKIKKTIDFAFWLYKKYNVKPNLMMATPLLGTRLYEIAKSGSYLIKEVTPKSLSLATQVRGEGMIRTKEFNPQDLKKFARQLDTKIARLDLMRRLTNPFQYFRLIKLFLAKPSQIVFYWKRLKGKL